MVVVGQVSTRFSLFKKTWKSPTRKVRENNILRRGNVSPPLTAPRTRIRKSTRTEIELCQNCDLHWLNFTLQYKRRIRTNENCSVMYTYYLRRSVARPSWSWARCSPDTRICPRLSFARTPPSGPIARCSPGAPRRNARHRCTCECWTSVCAGPVSASKTPGTREISVRLRRFPDPFGPRPTAKTPRERDRETRASTSTRGEAEEVVRRSSPPKPIVFQTILIVAAERVDPNTIV